MEAHTGHAGRGLRPQGAYVVYKLGAAEGALSPPPRCPVKPQLLPPNPASASAPNTEPHAELHQPNAT